MMSQDDVDGIFGHGTLSVVQEFQRRHGLTIDGIVGPATWALLFGSPPPTGAKKAVTRKIAKKAVKKAIKKIATKAAKKSAGKGAAKKRGRK
jgi:murein L,D-transpeptidase YcbB/YkuD